MATVITTTGKGLVTDRFKTGAVAEPVFVAWGTGAGTAAAGDTTLFTEGPEARVTGTSSQATTTTTNDTWRLVGTITASAARTPTNMGNFSASSAGTLHIKQDFTGIVLASGDSIQATIEMRCS